MLAEEPAWKIFRDTLAALLQMEVAKALGGQERDSCSTELKSEV